MIRQQRRPTASHLSYALICEYEWVSFIEAVDEKAELTRKLPEAVRGAVEAGDVAASSRKRFGEAWIEEDLPTEEE